MTSGMEIEIIRPEPIPTEIYLRLTVDEARKLRALMGSNGEAVWEAHSSPMASRFASQAFTGYSGFAEFTTNLYELIQHADPELLGQPGFNVTGRDY